jgi:hypothetical protein
MVEEWSAEKNIGDEKGIEVAVGWGTLHTEEINGNCN